MEIAGKEHHTAGDISHFPQTLTLLLSKVKYYFNQFSTCRDPLRKHRGSFVLQTK